jgi:hypothetical protein
MYTAGVTGTNALYTPVITVQAFIDATATAASSTEVDILSASNLYFDFA